ncbi:MAG TPA: carboxypeptidase-like regulatory domain-containing protein [Terriglobales bacterium]|nr:carboxypeptidase-like regulatory domain-containing protein [Terriglobales bacterium]
MQRLTIEVTGGDDNKPIENASVYVKTEEPHALKDKKTEANVKTNVQGIAHVPNPPTGRVLIQVVADGWKPFGHWFDISDLKQVVKIHLDRPPKWY